MNERKRKSKSTLTKWKGKSFQLTPADETLIPDVEKINKETKER